MVAPVSFLSRFKAGFVAIYVRLQVGVNPQTASRDAQTFHLSPNVSKFYAWQVGSWMNGTTVKSKFVAQSRPALYYSQQKVEHAKGRTRKVRNSKQPIWEFLYRIYRRYYKLGCRSFELNLFSHCFYLKYLNLNRAYRTLEEGLVWPASYWSDQMS